MKEIVSAGFCSHFTGRLALLAAVVVGSLTLAPTAQAAFHLWNISELYTNSSGTLQFIELSTTASGQNFVGGQSINITFGSQTHTFTVPSNLPTTTDTTNKDFLIGTAGIQAAGAPTPDFIMPNGFLFSGGGSISFFGANSGPYTALPTDGTMARMFTGGGNVVNNPKNFAGQTGKVVVADVWTGASTSWAASGDWTGAVPGATSGTTNTDTATFSQNAANSPLVIDAGRNLQNLTFDTGSVNSLTVGAVAGPGLLLTAGGTIQTTSTVVNAQAVNAPLVLEGNYTFTSGASSTALNFGGGITPGPTSGTTTLTLNGGNTGASTISGVLANHSTGILALTKSGSGTWTLTGANTYSGTTAVSAGRLKFNVAAGTPTIAAGATVTVAAGATLELSGSISALGAAGGNRAHITNSSTASGIVVSGTNQVVGAIDGSGTTQVNAGGALTADHIVQSALVIAGASGSLGRVTIDASNASGNPLSGSLANPLGDTGAAGVNSTTAGSLGAVAFISGDGSSLAPELSPPPPNVSPVGGGASSVPEPSSMLLFAISAYFLINRNRARREAIVKKREEAGTRKIG
jgi:autotransporter-associated beta strand protein